MVPGNKGSTGCSTIGLQKIDKFFKPSQSEVRYWNGRPVTPQAAAPPPRAANYGGVRAVRADFRQQNANFPLSASSPYVPQSSGAYLSGPAPGPSRDFQEAPLFWQNHPSTSIRLSCSLNGAQRFSSSGSFSGSSAFPTTGSAFPVVDQGSRLRPDSFHMRSPQVPHYVPLERRKHDGKTAAQLQLSALKPTDVFTVDGEDEIDLEILDGIEDAFNQEANLAPTCLGTASNDVYPLFHPQKVPFLLARPRIPLPVACSSKASTEEPSAEPAFTIEILDDLPPSTQLPVEVENLPGFDKTAGLKWIYPTTYAVRDYQYNIVQKALFRNTLVCLPTGLGKTFIAAVVMYNFYRWYPTGKIIFVAPTKPLVTQQMKACYEVMGIQQDEMVQMTGAVSPAKRRELWSAKRVFFMTPQIPVNDIEKELFSPDDVRCLVVDEAHKATGNYAYTQLIRLISSKHTHFRVLALSATPGSGATVIQTVLTNLLINHIEVRQEDSVDIIRYTFSRSSEKIVVPMDATMSILLNRFAMTVMNPIVDLLKRRKQLSPNENPHDLISYVMLKKAEEFSTKSAGAFPSWMKSEIQSNLYVLHRLCGLYENLLLYGMRSFYYCAQEAMTPGEHQNNQTCAFLRRNMELQSMITDLSERLGISSFDHELASSAGYPSRPYVYGHPKLKKLEEIVLEHFKHPALHGTDSKTTGDGSCQIGRIMIFSSLRQSVKEIVGMLRRHEPVVRVMPFVGQASGRSGQSKGLSIKEQSEILENFRGGGYNVLVSTCVGEEGLDIGEVDLVICFDTKRSAVRSIQRTGRTGRKRRGRIVSLLSEGKEEQNYRSCQSSKSTITKTLLNRTRFEMYQDNPRMVPKQLQPLCVKLKLEVPLFSDQEEKRKGRIGLDKWFQTDKSARKTKKYHQRYLSDEEFAEWNRCCKAASSEMPNVPRFPFLYNPSTYNNFCEQFRQGNVDDKGSRPYEANLSLSRHAAHQQLLQTTVAVPHSDKTRNFVEIMRQLNDFVMDIDQNACDADFVKMYPLAVENGYMDVRKEEICTAPTEERIDESNIQEDGRKSSCVAVVRQAKLHGISAKVKRPLISPRKAMKKRLETLECSTAGADVEAMLTKKFRSVTDTEKAANRSSHGMFVEPVERKIQTPVFQQDVHPQNAVISTKTTSIHFTADIPRPQLSDVEAPCDTEIERPFEGILAQVARSLQDHPVQLPELDVFDDCLPELDLTWDALEEASNKVEPAPAIHEETVGQDEDALALDEMADLPPDFFSRWDAGDQAQTSDKFPNSFVAATLEGVEMQNEESCDSQMMVSFDGALRIINESTKVVPESGLDRQYEVPRVRRSVSAIRCNAPSEIPNQSPPRVQRSETDFSSLNRDFGLKIGLGDEFSVPFGHRLGLPAVETNAGRNNRLTESEAPVSTERRVNVNFFPNGRGPSGYSTPLRERHGRQAVPSPDLSPLSENFVPQPSRSRVEDTFFTDDEDGPVVIPCTFTEESEDVDPRPDVSQPSSVQKQISNTVTIPDRNASSPTAGTPESECKPEGSKSDGGVQLEFVLRASAISTNKAAETGCCRSEISRTSLGLTLAPKNTVRSSQNLVPIDKSDHIPQNNRSTDDHEDEDIVFRRRRRMPPVAFETPEIDHKHDRKTDGPKADGLSGVSFAPLNLKTPEKKVRSARKPLRLLKNAEMVRKEIKSKYPALQFLDLEVDVSDLAECSGDEEVDPSEYPSSFVTANVSDETNPTYMGAVYARAYLDSPEEAKYFRRPKFRDTNIFSQPFQQDEDYGDDSFISYSPDPAPAGKVKRKATKSKDLPSSTGWKHDFQPSRKQPRN